MFDNNEYVTSQTLIYIKLTQLGSKPEHADMTLSYTGRQWSLRGSEDDTGLLNTEGRWWYIMGKRSFVMFGHVSVMLWGATSLILIHISSFQIISTGFSVDYVHRSLF